MKGGALRLVFGLAALLLVGFAVLAGLHWLPDVPTLADAPPPSGAPCRPSPPQLQAGVADSPGRWNGRAGVLQTPASLVFSVCGPGLLAVQAHGSQAGGWGPLLLISLGPTPLLQREVRARQDFRLRVPHAGTLRLSFPNDKYLADGRTLYITRLSLQDGAACAEGVRHARITEGAGSWQGESGALFNTSQLTLDTCGGGVLRLDLRGVVGGGAGPQLRVSQAGHVLLRAEVRGRQHYNVRVPAAGPLNVAYTNGYYKELADRNLFIDDLVFQPFAPPHN